MRFLHAFSPLKLSADLQRDLKQTQSQGRKRVRAGPEQLRRESAQMTFELNEKMSTKMLPQSCSQIPERVRCLLGEYNGTAHYQLELLAGNSVCFRSFCNTRSRPHACEGQPNLAKTGIGRIPQLPASRL